MKIKSLFAVLVAASFLGSLAYAERGDEKSAQSSGSGNGRSGRAVQGQNRSNYGRGRSNSYQRSNGYYRNGNGRVYQNPNSGNGRGGSYNRGNGSYSGNGTYTGSAYSHLSSNYNRGRVSPALRRMGVKSLPPSINSGRTLSNAPRYSKIAAPRTGPGGAPFHGSVMGRTQMNSKLVRGQMSGLARGSVFARQANMLNSTENRAGHYYWHNWNGTNYCHYYDGFGCNWYGWNCGGGLFWSCWSGGNWWWYDPFYSRWDYWYGNNWWWQNPYNANIVYAYDGNGYVSSGDMSGSNGAAMAAPSGNQAPPVNDSAPNGNAPAYNGNDRAYSGTAANGQYDTEASGDIRTVNSDDYKSPDEQQAVQPQAPPAGGVFDSPDGNHEVRVTASGDAFLYDMVKNGPKPVYLDSNVKEVNFSKAAKGKTQQVIVILNDGTFETFDTKGKPVS